LLCSIKRIKPFIFGTCKDAAAQLPLTQVFIENRKKTANKAQF